MRKAYLPLFAAVAVFAGCDNSPAATADDAYMTASVTGAVEVSYNGSAAFHVGTLPSGGQMFQIVSSGRGGLADRGFAITRWDGGQLGTGTYPIQLVDMSNFDRSGTPPQGIMLQYGRTTGTANPLTFAVETAGMVEFFVADTGQLQITVSTAERVEGSFTISGFRYCPAPGAPSVSAAPCNIPSQTVAGAPRISVTGNFVAKPLDATMWPMPAQQ